MNVIAGPWYVAAHIPAVTTLATTGNLLDLVAQGNGVWGCTKKRDLHYESKIKAARDLMEHFSFWTILTIIFGQEQKYREGNKVLNASNKADVHLNVENTYYIIISRYRSTREWHENISVANVSNQTCLILPALILILWRSYYYCI
jgi:hypothetical protein